MFWASLAILLVTWGLVPTQAGIFSTKLISRSQEIQYEASTAFVPASKQEGSISYQYAESVYGIAVLNETLTSYMARNYTLAPFRPSGEFISRLPSQGNWTAETWLYSLDMHCEQATLWTKEYFEGYIIANSTNGCSFFQGLNGNLTYGTTNAFYLFHQTSSVSSVARSVQEELHKIAIPLETYTDYNNY